MSNSLSLVLKATSIGSTGFGTDTSIFRAAAANDGQLRADNVLLNEGDELPFSVGDGYKLTQFLLASSEQGLIVDLYILRAPNPQEMMVRLKVGGMLVLADSDIRGIVVKNTSTTPARVNVLIAKERGQDEANYPQ